MRSESEIIRINEIMDLINAIYDYQSGDEVISSSLDQLAIDVEWLIDRLYMAWSVTESYQKELREFYRN